MITAPSASPDITLPDQSLQFKEGKAQLQFGRFLCMRCSGVQYLQDLAEKSAADEDSKKSAGQRFWVAKVTSCEPAVALRIARNPHDQKAREEVLDDYELAPLLQHENIVPFLFILDTEAFGLIEVLPLYDGDLSDYLFRHAYKVRDVRRWMLPVCSAVGFMHGQKLVHSDIKPENILFRQKGEDWDIVVSDFGCTGLLGTEVDVDSSNCAPEVSSYWHKRYTEYHGRLAGVEFPKCNLRVTANDVWSLGFMIRFMVNYFHRDEQAKETITEFLTEPKKGREAPVEKLVKALVQQTREEKELPKADQTCAYCRVEDTSGERQELSRLLKVAQKAMTVHYRIRPTLQEITADLEAVVSPG